MTTRNLFILFLFFSIISCTSDHAKRKTDIERLKLKGNVRSYLKTILREVSNLNDPNETTFKEQYRELILFNKNGNITEKIDFTKNGKPYRRSISIYNSKDFEIESLVIKYPNDTIRRRVNKYDQFGNETESWIYDDKDSILNHSKSKYNKFDKKTELIILKSQWAKNRLLKVSYEYDKDGHRIKSTRYYADNSKTEWFTEYDSLGNETKWTVYDQSGNLERVDSTNYVYYSNGEIKEEIMFSTVDILGTYGISNYNENGDEIQYTEYFNDSITSKEVYTYDNQSKKTQYYNSKGQLRNTTAFIYKFESHGNVIKESEYENEKLQAIKEYKIEYYQ